MADFFNDIDPSRASARISCCIGQPNENHPVFKLNA
jgi:hypothetical protein